MLSDCGINSHAENSGDAHIALNRRVRTEGFGESSTLMLEKELSTKNHNGVEYLEPKGPIAFNAYLYLHTSKVYARIFGESFRISGASFTAMER